MVNPVIVVSITISYLLYFIPVLMVLRRGGWRGYLKIQNRVAGCLFEVASALLLAFLLLLAVPDLSVWLAAFIYRLSGVETGVFGVAPRPLFGYLYPACLMLFLFYIWKNRPRETDRGANPRQR